MKIIYDPASPDIETMGSVAMDEFMPSCYGRCGGPQESSVSWPPTAFQDDDEDTVFGAETSVGSPSKIVLDELCCGPPYQKRRSCSLKESISEPPCAHQKKVVRFADSLGFDLETVRFFSDSENSSPVCSRKPIGIKSCRTNYGEQPHVTYHFRFVLPRKEPGFKQRVFESKVALDTCLVANRTVTGTVRVANICFEKSVFIRYTINNWLTYEDVRASYMMNSCDGVTDRFTFSLPVPSYFIRGCRLQFAIKFCANFCEFWDNNFGLNYTLEAF